MLMYVVVTCVITACVTIGLFIVRHHRSGHQWPPDTVILHKIGKGPTSPILSPFAVKLESYLRLADIPYMSEYGSGRSSKGKTPWITYNGVQVADSQFCIDFLNKKLNIDLNKHLSVQDKAIAKAFQRLVEDNLYWTGVMWRWVYNDDVNWNFLKRALGERYRYYSLVFFSRRLWRQAWSQGTARHSRMEVMDIADTNMRVLSDFIGEKRFLMGSDPCEEDCAIFGMLAQILWHLPGSPHEMFIKEKYRNLEAYCWRVKEKLWSDWRDFLIDEPQHEYN